MSEATDVNDGIGPRVFFYVHRDFTHHLPWDLMDMLGNLFDTDPPKGFSFLTFDDATTMAHLVHQAGAFKSIGDARRNGWNKPVPLGFSDHVIGKRKIEVAVFNKYDGMYDHACNYDFCRCGNYRGVPPNAQFPNPVQYATTLCPFDPSSTDDT